MPVMRQRHRSRVDGGASCLPHPEAERRPGSPHLSKDPHDPTGHQPMGSGGHSRSQLCRSTETFEKAQVQNQLGQSSPCLGGDQEEIPAPSGWTLRPAALQPSAVGQTSLPSWHHSPWALTRAQQQRRHWHRGAGLPHSAGLPCPTRRSCQHWDWQTHETLPRATQPARRTAHTLTHTHPSFVLLSCVPGWRNQHQRLSKTPGLLGRQTSTNVGTWARGGRANQAWGVGQRSLREACPLHTLGTAETEGRREQRKDLSRLHECVRACVCTRVWCWA